MYPALRADGVGKLTAPAFCHIELGADIVEIADEGFRRHIAIQFGQCRISIQVSAGLCGLEHAQRGVLEHGAVLLLGTE